VNANIAFTTFGRVARALELCPEKEARSNQPRAYSSSSRRTEPRATRTKE
jgi:hypothetical protein